MAVLHWGCELAEDLEKATQKKNPSAINPSTQPLPPAQFQQPSDLSDGLESYYSVET